MSSVDVKDLKQYVAHWISMASTMRAAGHGAEARGREYCAGDLQNAIDAATEDAPQAAAPLPLAGVVVGPWHVDRGAHRARYFAAAAHHPDAAATMDFDEERWCWTVWHQRDCVKHGAGTAPTQALAEAAADAHLRELGATLEGDEPEASELPESMAELKARLAEWAKEAADGLIEWLMVNGEGVTFVNAGHDGAHAIADTNGELYTSPLWKEAPAIQSLGCDSTTMVTAPDTGPDHRVIRRNGVPIGVIDVTQVDALQPDSLNGQPVTMVVLSSGRRLPCAMGVVDLAWQLGISEVAQ